MSFWDNKYFQIAFSVAIGATIGSLVSTLTATAAKRKSRSEKQWAALHPVTGSPPFFRHHGHKSIIEKMELDFRVSTEKLHAIVKHFIHEMNKGLQADGHTLKMLPSYVTRRPNGRETGVYMALDLGGTNFRVCEVSLEGQGRFRMRQKKFQILDEIKKGTADMLFGFLAESISMFIRENEIDLSQRLPMGFTFSFPVAQDALKSGSLVHWNKGFEVSGMEGRNVTQLLQSELDRRSLNIEVNAIINDTVGTLIAHAYNDPQVRIGVILGTGTNAAYVEQATRIPKYKGPIPNSGEMIINIEWGAFDNEKVVLPVTKYDIMLDRETPNPGWQTFEKMISGLYLGEIVRHALIDLIDHAELFQGHGSQIISQPYSFETSYMSRIERDHSAELVDTSIVLEGLLGLKRTTLEDRTIVKRVCELVGMRAARLSAAAVGAVISKVNCLDGATVGIDGSVFEHYPHFKNRMLDALVELFGFSAQNITLQLARDGSGVGAALIAMGAAQDASER